MAKVLTVQEVFPIVGKPTITYVAQEGGTVEKRLRDAINSKGQLCLLTGPSKLGKTTLYRRVLSDLSLQPVVIRCRSGLSVKDFWSSALEDLNFDQIAERSKATGGTLSAEIGVNGELGWSWIAKVVPTLKLSGSEKTEAAIKRAVVHSETSAKHLIPVLRNLPVLLVVEDFHYLSDTTKREVFQQWKAFVDDEVSVLVVSTTHHASDIARSNADLRGRTRHVELTEWSQSDLALIPKRGFDHLGVRNGLNLRNSIATESCGLPIVAQQICQTFALSLDLTPSSSDRRKDFQPVQLKSTFQKVISDFYADYERDYERLLAGPRSGTRKYDTYGAILGAFALEPLRFSLRKHELVERTARISGDEKIPSASINSSLVALGGLQRRMGVTLLEWQSDQDMLHIVEPTFLFFLRQKLNQARAESPVVDITTLLRKLMIDMRHSESTVSRIRIASEKEQQRDLFADDSEAPTP